MAIIAYLTAWIPFWNSLDAVRRIHSDFELSSIIFFALLALFDGLAHWAKNPAKERRFAEIGVWCFVIAVILEGVAYPYGQRNDTLSERVIVSLDVKATHASDKAAEALTDSAKAITQAGAASVQSGVAVDSASNAKRLATGARKAADSFDGRIVSANKVASEAESHLADALRQTAKLEQQLSWRTVTPEQKTKLRQLLSPPQLFEPLLGLKINISFIGSDPEAQEYADELKDAMDGLGADISDPTGAQYFGATVPQGVIVTANPSRNLKANFLLNGLANSGVSVTGERGPPIMDEHAVQIIVGAKPRPKAQPPNP